MKRTFAVACIAIYAAFALAQTSTRRQDGGFTRSPGIDQRSSRKFVAYVAAALAEQYGRCD